jgi:serine/threonine protein kinase
LLIDLFVKSGSLDSLLYDKKQKLTPEKMISLVQGIARGVLHLHKHNIVHRDLAARNILLTGEGSPKISVLFHSLCFLFHFVDSCVVRIKSSQFQCV